VIRRSGSNLDPGGSRIRSGSLPTVPKLTIGRMLSKETQVQHLVNPSIIQSMNLVISMGLGAGNFIEIHFCRYLHRLEWDSRCTLPYPSPQKFSHFVPVGNVNPHFKIHVSLTVAGYRSWRWTFRC